MCYYQELAASDKGYIVRCNQCNYFQVYYASTILSISHKAFAQWIRYVEKLNVEMYDNNRRFARSCVIATPSEGVHFALTGPELLELQSLVHEAEVEVTALKLMELF